MSKHTPGPWWLNIRNGRTRIYSIYGGDDRGKTVCRIHAYKSSTTEANARLVAAAPELLEALKDMVKEFDIAHIESAFASQVVAWKRADALVKATEQEKP